ncbi:hypothetical protein [Pseudodesulfovibrio sediminis]|uniref:Uncharacterized protein n=1 Tax=Pseudodesulfovibrio sediminis TaxID=2810563 RepID=A0ABM7P770_9BACT|nr:hypothetical protein [Pseudodesulfovibrio sediminis]BCS88831.1 hypothetical protein PSDVSF_20730 [Pseudodesulfovibrio sediminis]
MSISPATKGIIQNICNTVTIIGLCLVGVVLLKYYDGGLAPKYFPESLHTDKHHVYGLLLALPIPLHVTFIGLIVQKRWLSANMARFAWIGITVSGIWLGIALLIKIFAL